jgi:endonuclease/exonuclease/phosphatase family metal-dependent hydrolase
VRLRVLSYNIHRAIGLDRRFRPERIVEVLDHYDADIALLQEVDEGVPRSRELKLARELAEAAGYENVAFGSNVTLRKGRYGNATLSRYPIVRERNIDLTIGKRKRRGAQHTTLRVATDRRELDIEIFNLHLGLSARERQQQMGQLVRSPELRRLPRKVPCLVGGDFNDWRSLLGANLTASHGFHEATLLKSGALRTYPSFAPRGSLDRVFHRGALRLDKAFRCRLAVSRVASDHLPIILDLRLT